MSEPILIDAINAEKARDEEPTVLTVPLAQRYGFPPFSVIDRRSGHWNKRKRRWNDLGLTSMTGRSDALLPYLPLHAMNPEQCKTLTATSIFDPCLCELAYDWFSPPGGTVLDPFAGGSVRGIVASHLGRPYTGIDLRPEQVEANEAQRHMADPSCPPVWIVGDSMDVLGQAYVPSVPTDGVDFVFSCPPYFDLEGYSTGPQDLSGMTYTHFMDVYRHIIDLAVQRLRPDRFAAWVISDVRDPKGYYRGLVSDTIRAFEDAGAHLYNDIIIVDPVGSVAVRAARPFDSSRKVARLHQHMLVFVKGDPKRASMDLNCAIEGLGHGSLLPSGDTLF